MSVYDKSQVGPTYILDWSIYAGIGVFMGNGHSHTK